MKITGWVLVVFGALSLLGAIIGATLGREESFGGIAFIVLGAYLIHRANQKKQEEEDLQKWN